MSIKKAQISDLMTVKDITHKTIREIYTHYYPKGAVEFFLDHHSEDNIAGDIVQDRVFLCFDREKNTVGTVTVKENEICRLFVLPECQGNGYGRELLNFAEDMIFEKFSEIILDASLPAKRIYLKRGYSAIESHTLKAKHGDFLCYDVMEKKKI